MESLALRGVLAPPLTGTQPLSCFFSFSVSLCSSLGQDVKVLLSLDSCPVGGIRGTWGVGCRWGSGSFLWAQDTAILGQGATGPMDRALSLETWDAVALGT